MTRAERGALAVNDKIVYTGYKKSGPIVFIIIQLPGRARVLHGRRRALLLMRSSHLSNIANSLYHFQYAYEDLLLDSWEVFRTPSLDASDMYKTLEAILQDTKLYPRGSGQQDG